jgi:hypothetical protein
METISRISSMLETGNILADVIFRPPLLIMVWNSSRTNYGGSSVGHFNERVEYRLGVSQPQCFSN